MQLYVDMDGTTFDFDQHYQDVFGVRPDKLKDDVDWNLIKSVPHFYRDIPPMKDMPILWAAVKDLSPIFLSGIPKDIPTAAEDKRACLDKHLSKDVPLITCPSKDKSKYCKPGDILIDDWEKYKDLWVAKGGIWITHHSAFRTIRELKKHLEQV